MKKITVPRSFAKESLIAAILLAPGVFYMTARSTTLYEDDPLPYFEVGLPAFVAIWGGFRLAGSLAKRSDFPWVFFLTLGIGFSVIFLSVVFFVGCLAAIGQL